EYDTAYGNFVKGKKPSYFYVYFKIDNLKISEIDKDILDIVALRKQIANAEQIYNDFSSDDELILKVKKQLEIIISELFDV
ncbi:MAG: hypothetical protein Q8M94_00310, partial [Ignavibacteria bacterium]|nr:hypothetical protein [Ignavibacteria bacterium]